MLKWNGRMGNVITFVRFGSYSPIIERNDEKSNRKNEKRRGDYRKDKMEITRSTSKSILRRIDYGETN